MTICLAARACAAAFLSAAVLAQERELLRTGWTFAPGARDARPDEAAYRAIAVPGTFEDLLGEAFDGSGWYRRTLDLRAARGARVRIEFTAAATEATVYWNGTEVGRHLGGWTPFRVELPAASTGDEGLLEVFLDEKVGHNTQGFHPIIQPHFGGLWQDVVLCVDRAPVLDRFSLLTFGDGATGALRCEATVLPGPHPSDDLEVAVVVRDGAHEVARAAARAVPGTPVTLTVPVPEVRRWSPRAPHLYRVAVEVRAGGETVDRVERRLGFRDVRADGHRLLLNGEPLSVRGMLHWGYEPPRFAPNPDPEVWRREMEDLRARGFNLVKACLWLPPRSFYETAEEVGMLVWQEYPTWHPKLTAEYRDELAREFHEFFLHDRSHACVPFRSLTCETGHSADLAVVRALYDDAKATVPQTLVVDDSSWIEWLRVFDFYDDHPYGNNSWWPGKLRQLREYIAAREAKPLLLGECIAADTWFDLAAWRARHGGGTRWFAPRCLGDQPRFEAWLEREFGAETLAQLQPSSHAYALRMRKYQIERLRLDLPHAGYTVSVIRDVPLCRMGFYDDFGAMKWSAGDWVWHGDTMLCLDTPEDARAFPGGEVALPVRVAHAGSGPCTGTLRLRLEGAPGITLEPAVGDPLGVRVERAEAIDAASGEAALAVEPGSVSEAVVLRVAVRDAAGTPAGARGRGPGRPVRVRLHAELHGSHPARNTWDLWVLPEAAPADASGVRIVDALDPDTLAFLRGGGRVLLRAGDRPHSLKTQAIWFLRGECFAPPHPLHARVPAALLEELQTFDLETGRVLLWDRLQGQIDPILAFWETHDIAEVRAHLFAGDCRVGEGRLLVSVLDHEFPAGRWLLGEFVRHLTAGPAPARALREATVAALAALLASETIPLPEWELRTDPKDEGLRAGFAEGKAPADGWLKVHTRGHWEGQGVGHYDGVAWYRTWVDVPASWQDKAVRAVFEGVDDSFRLYVNGTEVARFGDPEKDETVWLQRVSADVSAALRPGERNAIVLRVVDHRGAGGVWKPVFLTTAPADASSDLLHAPR